MNEPLFYLCSTHNAKLYSHYICNIIDARVSGISGPAHRYLTLIQLFAFRFGLPSLGPSLPEQRVFPQSRPNGYDVTRFTHTITTGMACCAQGDVPRPRPAQTAISGQDWDDIPRSFKASLLRLFSDCSVTLVSDLPAFVDMSEHGLPAGSFLVHLHWVEGLLFELVDAVDLAVQPLQPHGAYSACDS